MSTLTHTGLVKVNKPKRKSGNWEYGCSEKVRFESAKQADEARAAMQTKHPLKRFKSYRCQSCGKFHIGGV